MAKRFIRKLSILLVAALLVTSCPLSTLAIDEAEMIELSQPEAEQEGNAGDEIQDVADTDTVTGADDSLTEAEGTQDPSEETGAETELVVVGETGVESSEESTAIGPGEAEISSDTDTPVQSAGSGAETIIKIDDESDNQEPSAASPTELKLVDITSEPVDGVIVTVTAQEGTFPEGSKLQVTKVAQNNSDLQDIEAAVDNAKLIEGAQAGDTETDTNIETKSERYTFDIKVVTLGGEVIQPSSDVQVKFALADSTKPIADANVYHLEKNSEVKTAMQTKQLNDALNGNAELNEETKVEFDDYSYLDGDVTDDLDDTAAKKYSHHEETETAEEETKQVELKESSLIAKPLDVIVNDETAQEVQTVTEGFSYYVVEFFYNTYRYVLNGDEEIELSTILDSFNLNIDPSTITKVEVSDASLFVATKSEGVWYVQSLKPFNTEEWMKVYVGGVCYEVKVTDTGEVAKIGNNTYSTLGDAFEAAVSGDRIELLNNIVSPGTAAGVFYSYTLDCTTHERKNVTLDFCGFTLYRVEIQVLGGASIIINGSYQENNVSFYAEDVNSTITINDGVFLCYGMEGAGGGLYCVCQAETGARIHIKGGTIGDVGTSQIVVSNNSGKGTSTIDITGNAIINAPSEILVGSRSELNIGTADEPYTGNLTIGGAFSIDGVCNFNSGTIEGEAGIDVFARKGGPGAFSVNGGTLRAGVRNNGTFTVNGGILSSSASITNAGTIHIIGGTINGIINSTGIMNITGGTVLSSTLNNNGLMTVIASDKKIRLDGIYYFKDENSKAVFNTTDDAKIEASIQFKLTKGELEIGGGTFSNKRMGPILTGEYAAKMTIKGGVFRNSSDFASQWANKNITLLGGKYIRDTDTTLESVAFLNGKATKKVGDYYTIVDQAMYGSTTGTLSELLDSAPAGSTITLLGNIYYLDDSIWQSYNVVVSDGKVLDLAENTLQCNSMNSNNGIIIDTSDDNIGLLKTSSATFDSANGNDTVGTYMPIYNSTDGGYNFYRYKMATNATYKLTQYTNIASFPWTFQFCDKDGNWKSDSKAYNFISAKDDYGLNLYAIVTLTRAGGNSKEYKFNYINNTAGRNVLQEYMAAQISKRSKLQKISVLYRVPCATGRKEIHGDSLTVQFYIEGTSQTGTLTGFNAHTAIQDFTFG